MDGRTDARGRGVNMRLDKDSAR